MIVVPILLYTNEDDLTLLCWYIFKLLVSSVGKIVEDKVLDSGQRATKESMIYLSTIGLPDAEGCDSETIGWKHNLKFTLSTLLDTSLLYSPSFLILAVSGFLTLSCFYVPYNYLGQHLDKIKNLTQTQRTMPVSLLGIINIAARIVCGWIADRPQVDALLVSNLALIAAGIATCSVPFFTEFWHFIAFCIPFATGVACFAALRSVICVDLFGLAKLSNAFGILLTFMGFGAIVGSPLAAFMKDLTGNFDVSFYVMGFLMTTSGAICMPLRKMRIREEKRAQERDAAHVTELAKLN
ncbi:hypothetical protein DICVIV_13652 [Dictyocaulus viviparus]|uniref:Major facilitator superfamily (MFS) profile domain-containing protein n=1 Tax=Dictyocaulus viviparus TaxID=29172 RepID=A0A0D8X9E6_DICVI|nr:hypothetical protein DICVIV_13652 [Dictyocaulus viviparus]